MQQIANIPEYEAMKDLFDCCFESGELTWKRANSNRIKVGSSAGSKNKRGYTEVRVSGKLYLRHRIVFYLANGWLPAKPYVIDHEKGVEFGDGVGNLRVATQQQNCINRTKLNKNNTSGSKGVFYDKEYDNYRAKVEISGIPYNLGVYSSREAATKAVSSFTKKHFGEFHNDMKIH